MRDEEGRKKEACKVTQTTRHAGTCTFVQHKHVPVSPNLLVRGHSLSEVVQDNVVDYKHDVLPSITGTGLLY